MIHSLEKALSRRNIPAEKGQLRPASPWFSGAAERRQQPSEVGGLTTRVERAFAPDAIEIHHQDVASLGVADQVVELQVAVAQAVCVQATQCSTQSARRSTKLSCGQAAGELLGERRPGQPFADHLSPATETPQSHRSRAGDSGELQPVGGAKQSARRPFLREPIPGLARARAPYRVAMARIRRGESCGHKRLARDISTGIERPSLLARESVPRATGMPMSSQRATSGGGRRK